MDDDTLFDIIEQAYDCAVDGQWNALLERISPLFGDSKVVLSGTRQPGRGQHMICTTHGVEDLVMGYMGEVRRDPCFRVAMQRPAQPLCLDPAMRQLLEASPAVRWYREMEADHAIGCVYSGSPSAALFAMNRPARRSQYSDAEQRGFAVLSAHMGGALKSARALADLVHQRLGQWHGDRVNGDAALAIVRANGSPVFVSQAMERLLDGRSPFRWSHGGLRLQQHWHDYRLMRAHQQVVNGRLCSRLASSIPVGRRRLQVVPLSAAVYENASLWLIS